MKEKNIQIRIIRNFTIEPMEPYLVNALKQDGIIPAVNYGGFSSAFSEVVSLAQAPESDDASIYVLALGLEEAGPDFGHAGWPVAAHCEQLLSTLRLAIKSCRGLICINTLLAPLHDSWGMARGDAYVDNVATVEAANVQIRELAQLGCGRVALCDWSRYARVHGESGTYDLRFWMSSGAPFSPPFLKSYALDIAKVVRAGAGILRKCIVLDCDNTLWGGVVGEDGLDGIALSGVSVPGRYYQEFQKSIVDLVERGVLVALCSKNDEQDVFAVLERHPDSVLKRQHIAAFRINWKSKPENLRELAKELGIGLDSFVFIDDSAIECDQVATLVPEVKVARVPERLEDLPFFLHRNGFFESLVVTRDDHARTNSYQQQTKRRVFEETATDLEGYLRKIGTRILVRRCRMEDVGRVVQLTQRTNQFNLTGGRYNESQIRNLRDSDSARVYCGEIDDQFGALGLTAVILVRHVARVICIEAFMVSCRALGRQAEFAFVGAVFSELHRQWGDSELAASFVPSEKNKVAATFWTECGLSKLPRSDGVAQNFSSPKLSVILPKLSRPYIALEIQND